MQPLPLQQPQPEPFSILHAASWRVAEPPEAVRFAVEASDACVVAAVASTSSADDGLADRMDLSVVPDTVLVVVTSRRRVVVAAPVRPSLCSLSFGSFVVHNRHLHPFLIIWKVLVSLENKKAL